MAEKKNIIQQVEEGLKNKALSRRQRKEWKKASLAAIDKAIKEHSEYISQFDDKADERCVTAIKQLALLGDAKAKLMKECNSTRNQFLATVAPVVVTGAVSIASLTMVNKHEDGGGGYLGKGFNLIPKLKS